MARLPLHPLLLAAYPVLSLWAGNLGELTGSPLNVLGVVLLMAAAATAIFASGYRDWRRGALLGSGLALVGLNAGRLTGGAAGPLAVLGGAAVALLLLAILIAKADPDAVLRGTAILNIGGALLVAVSAFPVLLHTVQGAQLDASGHQPPAAQPDSANRDIYYIVLDRYPRDDSLQRLFDFDNGQMLRFLESQGFEIAEASVANYNKTAHSLASTLNLDYLDDLSGLAASAGDDLGYVHRRLRDHEVGRVLTDAGYEYVHLGSWFGPTADARHADTILNYDHRSEFARVFEGTTAWPAIASVLPGVRASGAAPPELDVQATDGATTHRIRHYSHARYQFSQLERLAGERPERPRFVFAHILLPHEPYVFGADGSWVSQDEASERSRATNITEQVRFVNRRLTPVIQQLLEGPESTDPVIVLQADEGPHPVAFRRQGDRFDWTDATTAQLREKLRILNAYHLPGPDPPAVPEDMTPVNTFRVLFDHYLGLGLPRLDDRSYIYRDGEHLYDFTEVTRRVR